MRRAYYRLKYWYGRHSVRTRILLVALPLFLLVTYASVRELALRSADHVTITIIQSNVEQDVGHAGVVYRQTFGADIAGAAEYLLNDEARPYMDLPTSNVPARLYFGPTWRYHFAFYWHGFTVEVADMTYSGGAETYTISALGMPDLRVRRWLDNAPVWYAGIRQLAQQSGGAIPLPPQQAHPVMGAPIPYWTPLPNP